MATSKSSLESTLSAAWQRRGLLACMLWPLSLLFGLLAALRRRLYAAGWQASTRLPVPVRWRTADWVEEYSSSAPDSPVFR